MNRHTARGFTLIEIMVSIGILSLVMFAIHSCWTSILRGSQAGLAAAAASQRLRMSMQVLEDALVSTRFYAGNAEHYAFLAEYPDSDFASLSFVARLSESFPRSGRFGGAAVRRLTFSVEPGETGENRLVLRQVPLLLEPDIDEEEYPLVLAREVGFFHVLFWDARQGDWVDEWAQTNQLPPMVQISLGVGRSGRSAHEPADVLTRVVALPAQPVQQALQLPRTLSAPARPGGGGRPPAGEPPPGSQQTPEQGQPRGEPPGRPPSGRPPR